MDKNILKTLNYYNAIANGYLELYHEEQIKKISLILDYLPKFGIILDLGSGDGVFNNFLLKENELISLDLSFKLLKLNSNIKKINASILNLPIKSEKFSFIVSFSVFQDLPNPTIGIDEVHRVLVKNGIFIISFLHMSKNKDELINYIKNKFVILEKIDEIKDVILVLKKK